MFLNNWHRHFLITGTKFVKPTIKKKKPFILVHYFNSWLSESKAGTQEHLGAKAGRRKSFQPIRKRRENGAAEDQNSSLQVTLRDSHPTRPTAQAAAAHISWPLIQEQLWAEGAF